MAAHARKRLLSVQFLNKFGSIRVDQMQRDWLREKPIGSMSELQKINGKVKPVASQKWFNGDNF